MAGRGTSGDRSIYLLKNAHGRGVVAGSQIAAMPWECVDPAISAIALGLSMKIAPAVWPAPRPWFALDRPAGAGQVAPDSAAGVDL
jgi:hypothetical protein